LLGQWKETGVDSVECSRRLVDLIIVSVLLDAGAGDVWKFTEERTGLQIERSEGLAVASLYAFTDGLFSDGVIGVNGTTHVVISVGDFELTVPCSIGLESTYF
jgi:hypothetical protein